MTTMMMRITASLGDYQTGTQHVFLFFLTGSVSYLPEWFYRRRPCQEVLHQDSLQVSSDARTVGRSVGRSVTRRLLGSF